MTRAITDLPHPCRQVARISEAVTGSPLLGDNRIDMLQNGEEAYPAMLKAIQEARESVFLTTYIFETNRTGRQFIDALARANRRGVDVRVIIDGVGELYSLPWAGSLLKRKGVRVSKFLPPKLIPPTVHINLRNHRKILVADGRIGFVGGMNIGDRHLADAPDNPSRVIDVHFRLEGPIVTPIQRTFLEDWFFCTGEHTIPPPVADPAAGNAICRVIVDGPNETLDKLDTILVGAVSSARKRVLIMTPYFLPSRALIAALQTAALRGVAVWVILPARNNLPVVHWATKNMLRELVQLGVRIFYQPPPFVHSKLFVVDGRYAQIGSPNIDPRSLRLNFELALEVFDPEVAAKLAAHIEAVLGVSREIDLTTLENRPLAIKIRDALAWLFTPYL